MRHGLSVSNEAMGAFIDAVYAIAVTILALELPAKLGANASLTHLGEMLLSYAISFSILFSLWLQHRRINLHIEHYYPTGLWLNAAILMLACLIPRATTFVFDYGGDVILSQLVEAIEKDTWTLAEVSDAAFISIVVLVDVALIGLLYLTPKEVRRGDAAEVFRSKVTISAVLVVVMASSLLFPFENRLFLVFLPLFLMLEHRVSSLLRREGKQEAAAVKPASAPLV